MEIDTMSDSSGNTSEISLEAIEEELEDCKANCLFCDEMFKNVALGIDHCKFHHNFDIFSLRDKFDMDHYKYIKLINYIRSEKPQPFSLMESSHPQWLDDKYLKPTDANDSWLWFDLDGLNKNFEHEKFDNTISVGEDGSVTMSNSHFSKLHETILQLTEQVKEKEDQLRKLEEIRIELEKQPFLPQTVCDVDEVNDMHYFSSYTSPFIHWEMLQDSVRTHSFKNAIHHNKSLFSGKTVLDLGSGTGILSLMMASVGAKKVVGVEYSDIFYNSLDIIRDNGYENIIEIKKGKLEQMQLTSPDKFDIIISEWMGYFLLYEGMIDSLIDAREKYLKKDGIILPSKCTLNIVGASDIDFYNKCVTFWDNVHGFNMNSLKPIFMKEAVVNVVKAETVVTDPYTILKLNTRNCTSKDTSFKTNFELVCHRNCQVTHIVGYFDVYFDLDQSSLFTTSPFGQETHWKQTSFLLKNSLHLKKGDTIHGEISVRRNIKKLRFLIVSIKIEDEEEQQFFLS